MNVIDFVAIIPFWIKMTGATKSSFGVLRIIRLTRLKVQLSWHSSL